MNGQVKDPPKPFPKLDRLPEKLREVRESDVIWATRLWQRIDLRQPMNMPLNQPLDSVVLEKRSFFQLLLDEVIFDTTSEILIYKDYDLRKPLNRKEIIKIIRQADTILVTSKNNQVKSHSAYLPLSYIKSNLIYIDIMEDWFFDQRIADFDRRILAIGVHIPIFKVVDSVIDEEEYLRKEIYQKTDSSLIVWFYYPTLRPLLANSPCYRHKATSTILSYDEVFIKGHYSDYIIHQENEFDKAINEYTTGLKAVLESSKMDINLFNANLDMWEY